MLIVIFVIVFIVTLFLLGGGEKKQYGIPSVTLEGVHVRSKSEKRIADYFTRNGIHYMYEKPVHRRGFGGKKISNPDFYLTDYDVYVEYWGLVDADDKRLRDNYVRTMKWKMRQYHENKVKFVSIYPSNLENLDWVFRKKFETASGQTLH